MKYGNVLKCLKILNEQSEANNRRRKENKMDKRKTTKAKQ